MKSIILFRHAKSDWSNPFSLDHERPINKRGIKAAKKMGLYLSNLEQIPELVISSTALRAKQTIDIAMKEGKWKSKIQMEKKIYNSSVEILINVLQNVDNLYYNICLVGHEPTFSSFIAICSNSSIIKFPTGSMAKIEFEIKKWENINLDKANIQWIKKPKELDI